MNLAKGKFLAKYKTTLFSVGVSSFDSLINGGLATGTITLIEEDFGHEHSDLICKHFVSIGLSLNHQTAVLLNNTTPDLYLKSLPKVTVNGTSSNHGPVTSNLDNMDIAWRYKMMKPVDAIDNMNENNDDRTDNDNSQYLSTCMLKSGSLESNLRDVINFCKEFVKKHSGMRKPLRILIPQLGLANWGGCSQNMSSATAVNLLTRFVLSLRSAIRGTSTVVVLTTSDLVHELTDNQNPVLESLRGQCDNVFRLESFEDRKGAKEQLHLDATGLMKPIRLGAVNSLEPLCRPNTQLWSCHARRRRILLKEFSLPPCLEDTASRTSQAPSNPAAGDGRMTVAPDF